MEIPLEKFQPPIIFPSGENVGLLKISSTNHKQRVSISFGKISNRRWVITKRCNVYHRDNNSTHQTHTKKISWKLREPFRFYDNIKQRVCTPRREAPAKKDRSRSCIGIITLRRFNKGVQVDILNKPCFIIAEEGIQIGDPAVEMAGMSVASFTSCTMTRMLK